MPCSLPIETVIKTLRNGIATLRDRLSDLENICHEHTVTLLENILGADGKRLVSVFIRGSLVLERLFIRVTISDNCMRNISSCRDTIVVVQDSLDTATWERVITDHLHLVDDNNVNCCLKL